MKFKKNYKFIMSNCQNMGFSAVLVEKWTKLVDNSRKHIDLSCLKDVQQFDLQ